MLKIIITLCLFMLSASAFADPCAIPEASAIAPNYDWSRRSEPYACLAKIVDKPADYYMLSLTYSPGFCAMLRSKGPIKPENKFQCDSNIDFGWVVHGLWAQALNPETCTEADGRPFGLHPRYCQGDSIGQLPVDVIRKYMCTQPGAGLLQSEWEKHGSCEDFTSAEAYFAKTQELYKALNLPNENPAPADVAQWLKTNNPQLQNIRTGYESKEIKICYDKNWNYMDCPI